MTNVMLNFLFNDACCLILLDLLTECVVLINTINSMPF